MSSTLWTEEHGILLKGLRQQAGLDVATFARKHILSPVQITQLENGGDSAFYNADIKFAVGKKLLHSLGHDLPEPDLKLPKTARQVPTSNRQKVRLPRPSFSLSSQNFFWPLLLLLIGLGMLGVYVEKSSDSANPIHLSAPPTKTPNPAPPVTTPPTSPPTSPSSPSTETIPKVPKEAAI